jgi:regulator of replication initiation timing
MEIISVVSNALGIASRLKEISKNIQDAEFNNLLADLSLELADLKVRLADVLDENSNLKNELLNYKHSQSSSSELQYRDGMYFQLDGSGPFCPGCFDSNKKIIRLRKEDGPFATLCDYTCPVCKEAYGKGTFTI